MNVFTMRTRALGRTLLALLSLVLAGTALAGDDSDNDAILPALKTITTLSSTVPANGDQNPYGVAQVKRTTGNLRAGHILVSNFNNSGNFQGTGMTIVDIGPDGPSLFAHLDPKTLPGSCPGGVGLTTALVVLEQGWVIVGSLPTMVDKNQNTVFTGPGCLIVLDSGGNPVETFYGSLINGPWDMTAWDGEHEAKLFVTNVLNGTLTVAAGTVVPRGTVTRLNLTLSGKMPALESITIIGSGFPERTDPMALVIGPTGVGLRAGCDGDRDDCNHDRDPGDSDDRDGSQLYVADTLNSRITVIDRALSRTSSAGTGRTLTSGGSLNGPLGLTVTPGGHILTVNSGDGFITEISPHGVQLAKAPLDHTGGPPPGAGALFGLTFDPARGVIFVDDAANTLNLLHH
jgi:DNA-binding beta-propeller fold protein YncE